CVALSALPMRAHERQYHLDEKDACGIAVPARFSSRARIDPTIMRDCSSVFNWNSKTSRWGTGFTSESTAKRIRIANGSFGIIRELDHQHIQVESGSRRQLVLPLPMFRHFDHGYSSTRHAAQGATVDRVIVKVEPMRSDELVNRQQFLRQLK